MPKLHGSQLAVEEINKAGGIMGRQIELIASIRRSTMRDSRSSPAGCSQRDKVDVLFAGVTSASREAVRPIVDNTDVLYFYTNQYEGGVCDGNMIGIGGRARAAVLDADPVDDGEVRQEGLHHRRRLQFRPDLRGMDAQARHRRSGGEIVGQEFIPLGVSQFGQTIQNIQKAKPDWLMSLIVGTSQSSFYEQAPAARAQDPDGQLDQRSAWASSTSASSRRRWRTCMSR